MGWYSEHRRLTWIMAAVVVAVAVGAVWLLTLPSNSDGLKVGDYGADKQHDWAQRLVTGLNSQDIEQVPLLRLNGQLSEGQRQSIETVMPSPGCSYELQSVTDRGQQKNQQVPGLNTAQLAYRFDATVEERCPGQASRSRDIDVLAIVDMGYWQPYYFG